MATRFVYKNLCKLGTLLDKCCQHPQYPATDAEIDSLSYFWRTRYGTSSGNGLFVVDATNNKINFDEGGAELTGTVTNGSYNGATLATAIAAAMNAAPGKALTYACAYSESTAKFTISAGSNFTIRWSTGTNKATDISDLCGFSDAADDTGAATYTSDNRRIHYPKAFLARDLGVAYQFDFIAILGHNFSSAAVITLRGADDSAFTSNVVTDTIAYYSQNIYKFLAAARTKRYVRLEVQDPANTNSYIQISTIMLGKYFEPNVNFLAEYEDGKDVFNEIERSDSLNLYGQIKPILNSWSLPFAALNDASKAEILLMLAECGDTGALVVCFDSTAPNTNSYLVCFADIVRPVRKFSNNWGWTANIQEFV